LLIDEMSLLLILTKNVLLTTKNVIGRVQAKPDVPFYGEYNLLIAWHESCSLMHKLINFSEEVVEEPFLYFE
jgi:hypothetical protein